MPTLEKSKRCSRCHKMKKVFHYNCARTGQLRAECADCSRAYKRKCRRGKVNGWGNGKRAPAITFAQHGGSYAGVTARRTGNAKILTRSTDQPPSTGACECCGEVPAKRFELLDIRKSAGIQGLDSTDMLLAVKFRCAFDYGPIFTTWECSECWYLDDERWKETVFGRETGRILYGHKQESRQDTNNASTGEQILEGLGLLERSGVRIPSSWTLQDV